MNNVELGDNEESTARAEQTISMLVDAFEGLAATGSVRALPGTAKLFKAAFGWWAGITRSSQAVLTLRRAGREHEAAPIVRSVVQHSLVLQWMVEVGDDAINAVAEYGDNNTRLLLDTLAQAKWDLPDGFNPEVPPRPAVPYGTPHDLATWLTEVTRCHPSWESAVPYIKIENGKVAGVGGPTWQIDQTGFCAIHLFDALEAFHFIFEDAPLEQELDQLQRELLATAVRQRRKLGLPIPPEIEETQVANAH